MMAKLSEDVLNKGRNYLLAQDLDGFEIWMKKNNIIIDEKIVLDTFEKCFLADDTKRAVKYFDAVFPDIDPRKDAIRALIILGAILLALIGIIGGLIFVVTKLLGL